VVDFILKRDKHKQFRFVSLQSETGLYIIKKFKIAPETNSVILIQNHLVFIESDAAIKIAQQLTLFWKLLVVFKIIPKKVRDKLYRWVAKNRYKWFGKKQSCRIPKPEEKIFFPNISDLTI
jgi:predicted DCC family thiol-disulfide oxidoreductase YuxK